MTLDKRINDDLQQKLGIQMDIVRRKKEFDFEKAKLAGKKLKEHFIDPIIFPIQVNGIRNCERIFSFRFKRLGRELANLRIELEMKTREAAKKKKWVLNSNVTQWYYEIRKENRNFYEVITNKIEFMGKVMKNIKKNFVLTYKTLL